MSAMHSIAEPPDHPAPERMMCHDREHTFTAIGECKRCRILHAGSINAERLDQIEALGCRRVEATGLTCSADPMVPLSHFCAPCAIHITRSYG